MSIKHYYDALDRLISNKPKEFAKGTFKINNNTVSKEAGMSAGSIKKERYGELISKIKEAERQRKKNKDGVISKSDKYKTNLKELDHKYQIALNRILMLEIELENKEKEILKLRSSVVNFKR